MPTVFINWLEGRPEEVKKKIVCDITDSIHVNLGVPKENIMIFVNEVSKKNLAKGGVFYSDMTK